MKQTLVTILVAGFVSTAAFVTPSSAAVTINDTSFAYSQNFDSLASSGAAIAWANNSTIAGWSLFQNIGTAITTYITGIGDANTGSYYSFGASLSSERALGGTASGGVYFGSPASGTLAGHIAVAFNNTTGASLNSITFSFDGEQWRNGGNITPQNMVLEYGFGSTFAGVSTWTAPGGGFDWTSPVATATAAAVDGNVAGLVAGRGGSLTGLGSNWTDGSTLWLRWIETNNAGNDHGLSIDNFAVSAVTAVPEPAAALLGGLGILTMLRRRR